MDHINYAYNSNWTHLKTRKLKCLTRAVSNRGCETVSGCFPLWLDTICDSLASSGFVFRSIEPNHVLINRYEYGEGILHHTDGPSYHDRVAIISLQSSCLFTFRQRIESQHIGHAVVGEDVVSLVLEPNSLLVFSGSAYNKHLHGIDVETSAVRDDEILKKCDNKHLLSSVGFIDRGQRTSLTIRNMREPSQLDHE